MLLHLELQQTEQLQQALLAEFQGVSGVLDLYRRYRVEQQAGLLAPTSGPEGSSGGGLPFSEYVRAKTGVRGEGHELTHSSLPGGGGEGAGEQSHSQGVVGESGGRGGARPPVVTPSLISTTALLAKLTQQDIHT